MTDAYCRELSAEAGEPLAGSAAHVRAWIALEHHDYWEPKPLPPSTLPAEVKTRLEGLLDSVPASRFQFIRQPGRSPSVSGGPLLFLGAARQDGVRVLRFELDDPRDLLDLDVERALREAGHPDATPVDELLLVCCHGKRDRCCARWGVGLYQRLSEEAGEAVWQTTHLGGHRFAATMVALPQGVCFGRLDPDDGPALLAALRRGEIPDLDRVRGTSALEPVAQVAEVELRRRLGDLALPGPSVESVQPRDGRWRVALRARDGSRHEVEVAEERLAAERPSSCGDAPKPLVALRAAR